MSEITSTAPAAYVEEPDQPTVPYALSLNPQDYYPRMTMGVPMTIEDQSSHYLFLQVSRLGYFLPDVGTAKRCFYAARLDGIMIDNADTHPERFRLQVFLKITVFAYLPKNQVTNIWFGHDIPVTFCKFGWTIHLQILELY